MLDTSIVASLLAEKGGVCVWGGGRKWVGFYTKSSDKSAEGPDLASRGLYLMFVDPAKRFIKVIQIKLH